MLFDLIIIGAGPAGLTAGIYARTRKLNTLIIDATVPGGQLASLYPEKAIENYPGLVQTEAGALSGNLVNHAKSMGCELREHERALGIENAGDHLRVRTEKGTHETKAVILAIGMGLFKPRKLGAKGETEFEGKGVYYKMPEKETLLGKDVIFVGGGNSALEMALLACDNSGACVVHRRDLFRADEAIVERVHSSNIETMMTSEVVEIRGKDRVESVVIKQGDKLIERKADAVVVNIGTANEPEDMTRWGVEAEGGLIKVDTDMCTSRKGVFACGDAVAYRGKYKQIVVACGEAAIASNSAYKFIKEPYWAETHK
ncbi:NAD(P)/FAD-dependent oxidoreductase [Methanomassiliicoccus luminyensis]|uniref:NAD(P)/FAD-dependent oxidoreductase n=1 Tax=Methanomassiliicoccus luminyensis TaxID=1080712 RepID=UPI00035ECD8A|nr:NAD(P)/FAD-dependent oxidoreductase [Methanomassiliicoccus luminyensis]